VKTSLVVLLSTLAVAGCKRGGDTAADAPSGADAAVDGSTACTADQLAALEAQMSAMLDAAAVDPGITADPDFTVLLESADGRRYTHSHGASSPTTRYESASTSKWVSAVVILDLVDQGLLTLDTKVHDVVTYWTEPEVDLRDLLSFTSGFDEEPACLNLGAANFAVCVHTIYEDNEAIAPPPGTEYDYGPTHLQIAGAMAIEASGLASWQAVFDAWRARTGLFPTGVYDIPSTTNPRIAGGMHWTGEEYLAFLRAHHHGELLAAATAAELHADQRGTATVAYSPIWDALGEDWSYGLGNWVECPGATTPGGFDCTGLHRNSSAGAYGAYPFIDFDHDYFGLVARQGTLMSAEEGIAIFRSVESIAAQWADRTCN
jgi:CubicO group peptidase (beta-lactamase class C family)